MVLQYLTTLTSLATDTLLRSQTKGSQYSIFIALLIETASFDTSYCKSNTFTKKTSKYIGPVVLIIATYIAPTAFIIAPH